jgi:hypothetical protein
MIRVHSDMIDGPTGDVCTIPGDHLTTVTLLGGGVMPPKSTAAPTSRQISTYHVRDGRKKHPLYGIWKGILSRCYNPARQNFKNYGGRGIKVCDRWRNSFWAFVEDVGPRPSAQHSLDRYPDNDGDYEPGNVRWATLWEQGENRRDNRWLTAMGKTQTLEQWTRETGLSKSTLFRRIRRGWSDERVVGEPVHPKAPRNTFFPINGHAICRELGIKPSTVAGRMQRGWSFQEAIDTPVAAQNEDWRRKEVKARTSRKKG